jgi:hypothetical protein
VVIKTLDPDRHSAKNAGSGSGSGLNESGFETLFINSGRVYRYINFYVQILYTFKKGQKKTKLCSVPHIYASRAWPELNDLKAHVLVFMTQ